MKHGTTITLWPDDCVYAFLRIATDDVALVVFNNGHLEMPTPIRLKLPMCSTSSSVSTPD